MHRRPPSRVSRALLYASALRKVWYAQRRTPEEARELRRNQMPDGTYPLVPLVRPGSASAR